MLRIIELFGGIGACSKALKRLGIPIEVVDYVEIDKYAVKSYNALNGTNFEPQDITKWDKDFENIDLIMHGSPCFIKGTSILTDKSYKNIEDIEVGDHVLTHTNQYQKVLKIGHTENKQTYKLKVKNCLEVQATENHPFYCIERETIRNHCGLDYKYSEPKWKELKDIKTDDFISINIPKKEENPFNLTMEQCYLLGRYVADGHLDNHKRNDRENGYMWWVKFSIGSKKIEEFESHIKSYKYNKSYHSQNCYRVSIWDKNLVEFIKEQGFGEGASNKDIPLCILNLPKELAKSFLDGYMSGDGCYNKSTEFYSATTVSKKLCLKLQLLVGKIYNVASSVFFNENAPKHIIENRIVNQQNSYTIRYKETPDKEYSFIYDNKLWFKVSNIEKADVQTVYNLEVENDNSYTANNLIVHNCQDFSIAGMGRGGDAGSGTRSSLMYESIRIIKKLKPKYVIWENVKNLLSGKHRHNFENYLLTMDQLGYNNFYKVLNAKDFGVPQNRNRVFTVSIRKDINKTFVFPPEQELKYKLCDVLDENVDEKYYLSSTRIKGFSKELPHFPRKQLFEQSINRELAMTLTTRCGERIPDNYIQDDVEDDEKKKEKEKDKKDDGEFTT